MPRPEFIRVLPNPWTYIDTDGRSYATPAGFVLHDPKIYPPETQQRVGCEIASVEVLKAERARTIQGVTVTSSAPIQRTLFRYSAEPVRVHFTRYYANEVALGHLIAADIESAAACGIAPEHFTEAAVLLAELRAKAIEELRAFNPDAPLPSEPLTDAAETSLPVPGADADTDADPQSSPQHSSPPTSTL